MTLIEVLVALAILGLAAVGLAATHGNLLLAREAMRRLDEEDEALRLARERMLAPDATGETAAVGKDGRRLSGRVELSGGGMADWEAEIAPEGIGDLFAVTLTVRNEGAAGEGRTQSFHLTRPSWSSEADRRALLDAARTRLGTTRGFEATVGGDSGGGSRGGNRGRGEGGRGRPGEGMGRPGDGMGRPGDGSSRPGEGMGRPGEGATRPGDGLGRPGEGTTRPGEGTTGPRGGARPGGGGR